MQRNLYRRWSHREACRRTAVLACLVLGSVLSASGGVGLIEDLSGRQVFPLDNWWNLDVSQAPVDANSAAFIDFLNGRTAGNPAALRKLHPDFGPPPYGIPYVVVGSSQPLVRLGSVLYADESDVGAPGQPPGYPIPDEARTLANYIEGGVPGGGSSGDRHMLIVDRDRWLLFETFATAWNAGTGHWDAGSGAVFDLSSNARRPEGWTSADAAGLAVLPGLVRYDEVYGASEIRHALRFTSRAVNGYVWPASHAAGSTTGALPLGARLRLKASVDISGFPAPLKKIFTAMKKYGLILADNGSDLYISGTMDARWNNSVLNPAFAQLDGDDFEVVQLGWKPAARTANLSDFTSDLKSDILWRHAARGDLWLWPMDGASRVSESYVRTVADTNWEIRGQGDQNGDGKADILWRNKVTGQVYYWAMNGATRQAETYVATVDPAYDIVGTGDFDGDGKSDILWRNLTNGEVWIWLMDGAAPKREVYVDRADPGYVVKGVGDLDGDTNADIVWRHGTTGEVWVWLMNGTARLSQTRVGTVPDTAYQIAGVADFDGNGKADILWHHAARGDVWIWTMNGPVRVAETWVGTVPDTNYRIVGAGDYDGNTKADILWRNVSNGEVWIWLMDGTTKLSETRVATVPDIGYQIVQAR
jgi:hypothetical protein